MAGLESYGMKSMGPSGIVMDVSKAMAVLGFSPSQTFESTSMEEINKAFMRKLHFYLRPPLPHLSKDKKDEIARKNKYELRRLNEALQYLIKKRTKTKVLDEWKFGSKRSVAIGIALQALDEHTAKLGSVEYKQAQLQMQLEKKMESKKAQDLADEICKNIEAINVDGGSTRSNRFKALCLLILLLLYLVYY